MSMTKLSEHFSLAEMTVTSTGLNNTPDATQLAHLSIAAEGMEKVRAVLGKPIKVNSAFRSSVVNRAVGGVSSSHHCQGWAVDFVCPAFGNPLEVAQAIAEEAIKFDQLIYEGTWVHISFAPSMRQQCLTMKKGRYFPGLVAK